MTKRLTIILFTTFLLSVIITTILILAIHKDPVGDFNIKEYDMSYALGWGIVLFMTIATTPIYLNLYKKIRNTYFYSLLTFLLLPLAIAIWFSISLGGFSKEWKIITITILPYLFILIFHFFKYRKSNLIISEL